PGDLREHKGDVVLPTVIDADVAANAERAGVRRGRKHGRVRRDRVGTVELEIVAGAGEQSIEGKPVAHRAIDVLDDDDGRRLAERMGDIVRGRAIACVLHDVETGRGTLLPAIADEAVAALVDEDRRPDADSAR